VKHIVQFSTGAGSAEVAFRVLDAHFPRDVVLITADTRVEDPDNWRFAHECVQMMGGVEWVILADGRTPMQAGLDAKCVPNNRMAVCSRVLKRDLIRAYMDEHFDPADSIVYLGFDWTEQHRFDKSVGPWEPWRIAAPLMEPPFLTKSQILDAMRERGIEPPRLYKAGFSHANCGGACVRGGQAAWRRLLFHDPHTYELWEFQEDHSREVLGKDVAILRERSGPDAGKALPLGVFRERIQSNASLFDVEDEGACGCFMEEETAVASRLGGTDNE
jgi:hypothetical protein